MNKLIVVHLLALFVCVNIAMADTYTTLDYPWAAGTSVEGVDSHSNGIVGVYDDVWGKEHGFFFNGKSLLTLDVPGAIRTGAYCVYGKEIAGTFDDASGQTHGFLYNGKSYTTVDTPRIVLVGAAVSSVNEFARSDLSVGSQGFYYDGFSRWTSVYVPMVTFKGVSVLAGENHVASYEDAHGKNYGLIYNGTSWEAFGGSSGLFGNGWTNIEIPGSTWTNNCGIDGDIIVGNYGDTSGVTHGFLYVNSGTIAGLNVASSTASVPEPATLGLLCFCSLVLSRRRR